MAAGAVIRYETARGVGNYLHPWTGTVAGRRCLMVSCDRPSDAAGGDEEESERNEGQECGQGARRPWPERSEACAAAAHGVCSVRCGRTIDVNGRRAAGSSITCSSDTSRGGVTTTSPAEE